MRPVFTPDEQATLTALWDDRDNWWMYLYLLSDRLQEENELWADGVRFLCGIKQRPLWNRYATPKYDDCWWMPTTIEGFHNLREDTFRNYIPRNLCDSANMGDPPNAIAEFCKCWAAATPEYRTRLWSEWGGVPC